MTRKRLLLLTGLVSACWFAPVFAAGNSPTQETRHHEVAAKGAKVMPFDLSKTRHIYDDRPDGGMQIVVAEAPGDIQQVDLIRRHLRREAHRFSQGDFSDPVRIHGRNMPGLAELKAGKIRIKITYRNVPNGARLIYSSTDPKIVEAIHHWFAAQRSDHAAHGHAMPHLHHH